MTDNYCTAWELSRQYGISKVKTSRAIRSGQLTAFMKTVIDNHGKEETLLKWYIIKNQALTDFIEKERKF